MKISKAETRMLVKVFKELVRADVAGITSSDARDTVAEWLVQVGQPEAASNFENEVYKYQTGAEIARLERQYNS